MEYKLWALLLLIADRDGLRKREMQLVTMIGAVGA